MKIVMGIDDLEGAVRQGDLIAALRFDAPYIDAVNVVECIGTALMQPINAERPDLFVEYMNNRESVANELVVRATEALEDRGMRNCRGHILKGFVSNELMEWSEKEEADLLSLGSNGKTALEGVLLGSVTRKAVISAKTSLLISRTTHAPRRPLTVVLATDHSRYSDWFVKRFAQWAPRGIGKLVVTTVFPEHLARSISSLMGHLKFDVAALIRDELEKANRGVISALSGLGAECVSRIECGYVNEAIEDVMKREQADLLVLGAQGHGFSERFIVGSVALEQATGKPYSVLIVRS